MQLLKNSNINKLTINLEVGKLVLYNLIYNLGFMELKTFKTYIKTNLAKSFI